MYMRNLINVEKEIYPLKTNKTIPNSCKEALFIPAFSKDCYHHYFLVNFKTKQIICWNINLKPLMKYLLSLINQNNIKTVPYNKNLNSYMEAIMFAHSADYYNGKIYLSLLDGNCILELDTNSQDYDLIYDKNCPQKIYSSTNCITENKIYFTRWDINETFLFTNEQEKEIELETGYYDIITRQFQILKTFKGPDDIHLTKLMPDKNNLVIVQMAQDPVVKFPKSSYEESKEKMLNILENGLEISNLYLYNLSNKTMHILELKEGPAHIEVDPDDQKVYYLSTHNLSTNNDKPVTFGLSKIYKMRITNGKNEILDIYQDEDLYRAPSHRIFKFNGLRLMAIPVYYNGLQLVDIDSMACYKKIKLANKNTEVDLSNGPYVYPSSTQDKTPYTIDATQDGKYLYLSSLWNITILDHDLEEKVASVLFNYNKPLIAMGHALCLEL